MGRDTAVMEQLDIVDVEISQGGRYRRVIDKTQLRDRHRLGQGAGASAGRLIVNRPSKGLFAGHHVRGR